MRLRATILCTLLLCSIALLMQPACRKKGNSEVVTAPTPLTFSIPQGFPAPHYNFAANPITQQGFDLGKKIFYDANLSSDGQVSCGSCHQQFASFVQFDHDLGHGVNNEHTTRNPQPLLNLAWHQEMMWDGGVNHIEVQPLAPFTAPNEMNITIDQLLLKLSANPSYKPMYKAAFGNDDITTQRTLKALSQYMLMLVSANSKYDQYKRGQATFTSLELQGYQVYQAKCNSCHREPLFTDLSYRNIGLPINTFFNDYGRMKITNNLADSLRFKVPTLRNVALTQPYTHDGRIGTLDAMIDHYRFNVVNDLATDVAVRNKLSISTTEKAGLLAFLTTLTDTTFTKDKRFAQ